MKGNDSRRNRPDNTVALAARRRGDVFIRGWGIEQQSVPFLSEVRMDLCFRFVAVGQLCLLCARQTHCRTRVPAHG